MSVGSGSSEVSNTSSTEFVGLHANHLSSLPRRVLNYQTESNAVQVVDSPTKLLDHTLPGYVCTCVKLLANRTPYFSPILSIVYLSLWSYKGSVAGVPACRCPGRIRVHCIAL